MNTTKNAALRVERVVDKVDTFRFGMVAR